MPVFFEMGSVAQLTYGLLVCFLSFGLYMMFSPYADDSDDRLAQLCQMQIFFSLVSSLLLKWSVVADEQEESTGTQNLDVLLCVFTFMPVAFALVTHILGEGLADYFKTTRIDLCKAWAGRHRAPGGGGEGKGDGGKGSGGGEGGGSQGGGDANGPSPTRRPLFRRYHRRVAQDPQVRLALRGDVSGARVHHRGPAVPLVHRQI